MPNQSIRSQPMTVSILLFGAVLWGISWWPLKHFGAHGLSGALMVVASYGVVGIFALPTLWLQRQRWRSQTGLLVLIALLGGWSNIAFVTALMSGNVVRVMLLFYLAPVWGVLGGRIFLREHITPKRWFAVGLSMAGAFVLLGGVSAFSTPLDLVDVLALSAGLTFALNNVTTRAAQRIPMTSKVFVVFLGCAILASIVALLQGARFPSLTGETWGLILVFAFTWLLLATLAIQYGVTHMEAGKASILLIFELIAALVSAVLIGGEAISQHEWLGGALIASAALIEARSQ